MEERRFLNRELILDLKKRRVERQMSFASIAEATEALGTPVSKTTVARVFADGSEELFFRYDTTLKPIAQAVLGIDDPLDREARNEHSRLLTEISQQQAQEVDRIHDRYQRRIEAMNAEVKRLHGVIQRQFAVIVALCALALVFMAALIGYLAWDVRTPDQGAFRGAATRSIDDFRVQIGHDTREVQS